MQPPVQQEKGSSLLVASTTSAQPINMYDAILQQMHTVSVTLVCNYRIVNIAEPSSYWLVNVEEVSKTVPSYTIQEVMHTQQMSSQ